MDQESVVVRGKNLGGEPPARVTGSFYGTTDKRNISFTTLSPTRCSVYLSQRRGCKLKEEALCGELALEECVYLT